MKKFIPLIILLLLASCSSENIMIEQDTALEIMVDVVAYNRNVNDVSSRASINNGVITSFAPGDDFGLIVVDQNGTLIKNNYKFVLQKTGLAYRVDNAGNIISSDVYYNENYKYYAYAPYDSKYNNYTSIDDVIAKHIADFSSLYSDQSTQAKYNAADLLVSRNHTITGTTLRLEFTHAMSLMKIYYNGEASDMLTVEHPVKNTLMYKADDSETYNYIYIPGENVEVYGTATSKQEIENEGEITNISYWQTNVNLKENGLIYISIFSQPAVSYKTAGVDMGLPSGCIWANHNLGAETASDLTARGGKWYDADGNLKEDLMNSELHSCFDRGDYYSWGELETKYDQPAVMFNEKTGRISKTGDSYITNSSGVITSVTSLISGSKKGYYPETYVDRQYSYAAIDGNIAGTEYDVVRNKLWKGEWRIPNENEVDELVRNSNVEIVDWYYEDNIRYAPWIGATDPETGAYLNLHYDNSEFFGTAEVRPYRYLVTIFKFTSKINGEVLYFPGGTWSDWSIDMLCCNSRNHEGVKNTETYTSDYGGMYYFASSASHSLKDCSSYMEFETTKTLDENTGKITNVTPVTKYSSYVDKDGNTINLAGLTQNGHRYTGMLIRPVYGGKNWNTNTESQSSIRIYVEQP